MGDLSIVCSSAVWVDFIWCALYLMPTGGEKLSHCAHLARALFMSANQISAGEEWDLSVEPIWTGAKDILECDRVLLSCFIGRMAGETYLEPDAAFLTRVREAARNVGLRP